MMETLIAENHFPTKEQLRKLRRDFAELKEMVKFGAAIPGDAQEIELIKGLLARWNNRTLVPDRSEKHARL